MSNLISRQDAIETIRNTLADEMLSSTLELRINDLPSAQKTGRWINVDTVIKELGAECFAKRINGELIALGGVEDYAKLRGMEVEHETD